MKNRIGLILLAVACAGLGIALFVTQDNASKQKEADTKTKVNLSNDVATVQEKLGDEKQKSAMLDKDLQQKTAALAEMTNSYSELKSNMDTALESLSETRVQLKTNQEAVVQRDARISELEAQNQALDLRAAELSAQITNKDNEIADTRAKLKASLGDNTFLTTQLNRLIAEKAEMERQFNDLKVLRAQLAKLRDEAAIARRLDWMRRGVYDDLAKKGGERLITKTPGAQPAATGAPDLNVEVSADGSVKVIPPLTNRPAATNPTPPK